MLRVRGRSRMRPSSWKMKRARWHHLPLTTRDIFGLRCRPGTTKFPSREGRAALAISAPSKSMLCRAKWQGSSGSATRVFDSRRGSRPTPKDFANPALPCEMMNTPVLFRPAVAGLWECVRVVAPLSCLRVAYEHLAQKLSGTLIRSVLNEYTDFTNPVRALLSNQEAEYHGY